MLGYFLAFLVDAFIGDPLWLPHPVTAIGKLISVSERLLNPEKGEKWLLRVKGALLVLATLCVVGGIVWGIVYIASFNAPALLIITVYLLSVCFASRCMDVEARKVYTALMAGDLPGARAALSGLVGRETAHLERVDVVRAVVETVSENTVDGVTAPLTYAIFGPVGAFVYKAVNTMDSMLGYTNDRYRYFGTAAARLDDLLNLIPARLTALLMVLAGGILRLQVWDGFRILLRDRYKHKSPNSGHPEAAAAGLMSIQLGGPAVYFGKRMYKPYIGEPVRSPKPEDILVAIRLMYITSCLYVALMILGVLMWNFMAAMFGWPQKNFLV